MFKNKLKVIKNFFSDSTLVFICLLLFVILTRFFVSYTNSGNIIVPPETNFQLSPVGRDLYTGVYKPALKMINGEQFYSNIAQFGPGIHFFAVPFLTLLPSLNICALEDGDILSCFRILYQTLLFISIFGYIVFILLISKKRSRETKYGLFLFFIIFLLGLPGSAGLERGNIDIVLSLIVGYLLLILPRKTRSFYKTIFLSLIIGLIAGFIGNVKIFLLAFLIVTIFAAQNILITAFMAILTYVVLSSLPMIFGVNTSVVDLLRINFAWLSLQNSYFHIIGYISYNHSLEATASITSDCILKENCFTNSKNNLLISIFSKLLFFIVFVLPLLTLKITTNIKENSVIKRLYQKITKIFLFILKHRRDKEVIIFLFIFADAFINLFFRFSYIYRLYYSLPIVLLLWAESEGNAKVRFYCLISMTLLALKGFWIFMIVNPYEVSLLDPRLMNLFTVFHFYFLIKAGLENVSIKLRTNNT